MAQTKDGEARVRLISEEIGSTRMVTALQNDGGDATVDRQN